MPLRRKLFLLLPLLAGCMAAPSTLAPSPGGVNVTVQLPQSGYQTQYMASDISQLVIGLVDVDSASTPYLGYEGSTSLSSDPSYHPVVAGTNSSGSHLGGLLNFTGLPSLTTAQKVDRKRYLYRMLTSGIGTSRTVTFNNIKAGSGRYVAFAAAFTENSVTSANVIGFSQSEPFTVVGNAEGTQANAAPALTLPLTRRMGGLEVALTFNEGTRKLFTTDKLVVTLVDGEATRTPYFGYEASTPLSANPSYHTAIAGYWSGSPTATFFPQLFDYTVTPLGNDPTRGSRSRMLYHVSFQNSFADPAGTRTVRFTNLKPGSNYYVHAVAFQGGDGIANQKGEAQSGSLTVTRDATASTSLSLTLTP